MRRDAAAADSKGRRRVRLMPQAGFDAGAYWKNRLRDNFDLSGVGFLRRSEDYNRWVYRMRTEQLRGLIDRHAWPVKGRAVLDVGCGTGFFVDFWSSLEAAPLVGVDIAEVSIERLKPRFPDARFVCADISGPQVEIDGTFDYVSVFDVLYHIVDDTRFEQAAANLARLCRPGAKVLVTDMFGTRTTEVVRHVRNRSLEQYRTVFGRQGLKLTALRPLFFTLMPPTRLANRAAYWLGTLSWEALTCLARWSGPGRLWGGTLYRVDRTLQRWFDRGPSHHLAVFEFEGPAQNRT